MPINVYKTDKQIVKVQSTGPQGPKGEPGTSGSSATLPTGLVSGSSQIDFNGLNNKPSNLFSSSQQLPSGLISSSAQIGSTGIYSGSGLVPDSTIARIQSQFDLLYTDEFDNETGLNFNQSNLEIKSTYPNVGVSKITLQSNTGLLDLQSQNLLRLRTNATDIDWLRGNNDESNDQHLSIFRNEIYEVDTIRIDRVSTTNVTNITTTFNGTNIIADNNDTNKLGLQYFSDYSSTIKSNDRSIPDVGTIRNELTASYAMNGRPYKVYTALMNQTGTDDPVATVLENTIGSISWSRATNGNYLGSLTGAFPSNKTFLSLNNPLIIGDEGQIIISYSNSDVVSVSSINAALEGSDGWINNVSLEIRVYP